MINRIKQNWCRILFVFLFFLLEADVIFLLFTNSNQHVVQVNYSLESGNLLIRNERMSLTFFTPGDNNYSVYEGIINDDGMEFWIDSNIQKFDLCALNFYELNEGVKIESIQSKIENYEDANITYERLLSYINFVESCSYQDEGKYIYFHPDKNEFGVQLSKSFINALADESHNREVTYLSLVFLLIILHFLLIGLSIVCLYKYLNERTEEQKLSLDFLRGIEDQVKKNHIIILGLVCIFVFIVAVKLGVDANSFIKTETQIYNSSDQLERIDINGQENEIVFPKNALKIEALDIFFAADDITDGDGLVEIVIYKNGDIVGNDQLKVKDVMIAQKATIVLGSVDLKAQYTFAVRASKDDQNMKIYLQGNGKGDIIYEITYESYNYQIIKLVSIIFIFNAICLWMIHSKRIHGYKIFQIFVQIVGVVTSVWMIELMMANNDLKVQMFAANLLIAVLIYCVISLFFSSCRVSLIIFSIFCFIYGTISYFVLQIRGIPFLPQDIKSINVAGSVVRNYTFYVEFYYMLGVILFLCQILIASSCLNGKRVQRKNSCFLAIILGLFIQKGVVLNVFNIGVNSWNQSEGFRTYGHLASFYANIVSNHVSKPNGYAKEEVNQILNQYEKSADFETEDYANIVVVMNEAFSDLSIISSFETNQKVMPYIEALDGNVAKGNLYVSIVGGNTCNTEFEFLTGNTMAFLPPNSVAYQNYINEEKGSIVKEVKNYGFKSIAIHPYYGGGWNRNKVYPLLGMDDFYDIASFDEGTEYIRSYVSDKSNYEKVIEHIEQEEAPLFLFNVTMQNHGGYSLTYSDFQDTIKLVGMQGDYPQAEQYLSLINISDSALEDFVNKVQALDEKTIVCFFGDHQPFIEEDFLTELYGKEESERSIEEKQRRYCVPYVIVANFDLELDEFPENTSANYLGIKLLKAAGIEVNGYYDFLDVLSESYPVVNANGYLDAFGNWREWEDMEKEEQLSMYKKIQYGVLFDHALE